MSIVRDSTFAQLVRYFTSNRVFLYDEEKPGFEFPTKTHGEVEAERSRSRDSSATLTEAATTEQPKEKSKEKSEEKSNNKNKDEESGKVSKQKTIPPEVILVEWYGPDDKENPQNWSNGKKVWVAFVVSFLTTGVYMSAAIISPAVNNISEYFGVSTIAATLTLALYVLAYGCGPMLWSPLSEMPRFGRNLFYVGPMFVFVCLQVGAALTPTFAGLLVLRFLTGFCGSAPLATGGASMTDVFSPDRIPYAFAAWTYGAVAGPSVGPVIAAFAVKRFDWRWSMWITLMLTGLVFVLIFFALPETSSPHLLYRRAERLRRVTGNSNYKTYTEIEEAEMTNADRLQFYLIKPTEIAIKDPAVAYAHLYLSILYATYYLFFDAIPVVFEQRHGISVYNSSIIYLAIGIGIGISLITYLLHFAFVVTPRRKKYFERHNKAEPFEKMLEPALVWTWLVPCGLWIFAWTSQPETSIWGPIMGVAVYSFGVVVVFQCLFTYISSIYEKYAASVLAENDFLRSSLAAGLLIAGIPMFEHMGVQAGVSWLAGLNMVMSAALIVLYKKGDKLRARSKFAN